MRHSLHALPLLALGLLLHPLLTSCQEGSSSLPLVINEVHATPPEWVEILNLSDQAQPPSLIGRTSMLPYFAPGNFAATRNASFRSRTSISR